MEIGAASNVSRIDTSKFLDLDSQRSRQSAIAGTNTEITRIIKNSVQDMVKTSRDEFEFLKEISNYMLVCHTLNKDNLAVQVTNEISPVIKTHLSRKLRRPIASTLDDTEFEREVGVRKSDTDSMSKSELRKYNKKIKRYEKRMDKEVLVNCRQTVIPFIAQICKQFEQAIKDKCAYKLIPLIIFLHEVFCSAVTELGSRNLKYKESFLTLDRIKTVANVAIKYDGPCKDIITLKGKQILDAYHKTSYNQWWLNRWFCRADRNGYETKRIRKIHQRFKLDILSPEQAEQLIRMNAQHSDPNPAIVDFLGKYIPIAGMISASMIAGKYI